MQITKKVNDTRLTEREYRNIRQRLSYSSIKKFDTDRSGFYKEFVLGEIPKEKKSTSLITGDLVHHLLSGGTLEDDGFYTKFHIMSSVKPKGQMGDLTEEIYTRSIKTLDENGRQLDSFDTIFQEAFDRVKFDFEGNEVKFKGKDASKVIGMFDSDCERYYRECLENIGKTFVSVSVLEQAEKIQKKIQEHPYTSSIVNIKPTLDVECFSELPILFELEGVEYKSMVDKLVVDHTYKIIKIYDWKTTWEIDKPQIAYLKYGYYLQAAMYRDAVRMWAKEHDLQHYIIEPMVFVFCDVSGFQAPVKLQLSDDDVDRACRGFTYRGMHYNGLRSLQDDIQWCLQCGDWGNSQELEKNNGIVKLNMRYGSQ